MEAIFRNNYLFILLIPADCANNIVLLTFIEYIVIGTPYKVHNSYADTLLVQASCHSENASFVLYPHLSDQTGVTIRK